ncbi:DUF262 domain-containing protein [Pedobacter mendelii]|uniref:GmrSD restriction endonucleases N-terminal domain-containing protein n=1 Tax=Pedobacter mendelii TaxID=1908240 RepID=A0ABQ2BHG2_9SPHI|nr:DUF262 domain-containing protein [Pedobacter mendelii]GGI24388.1 hypothetical protein GCM10008119_12420 [Pedobacter mendelii]
MSYIETFPLQHSTILRIYSERDEIETSPEYQRNGGIWTPEKKQLLIDSIINNYDIPKIYFHQFSREERAKIGRTYSIIDGKQRLEAIWSFINNDFKLSGDFDYQDDESIKIAGMSYNDIAQEYPKLKIKFDSFVLPIICVLTDDFDLIEDMFSRLNEAAPLNSAEKRNAFGGDMVRVIREISNLKLFTQKVKFQNNRYQHFEIAARYLLVEASHHENGKLIDTKKVYLDSMSKRYKTGHTALVNSFRDTVKNVVDSMSQTFINQDHLLRTQGIMVVYYLLFKKALEKNVTISRIDLQNFDDLVRNNRLTAEKNYEGADFDLLEFDRLSQYGTNDVSTIKEKLRILSEYLNL